MNSTKTQIILMDYMNQLLSCLERQIFPHHYLTLIINYIYTRTLKSFIIALKYIFKLLLDYYLINDNLDINILWILWILWICLDWNNKRSEKSMNYFRYLMIENTNKMYFMRPDFRLFILQFFSSYNLKIKI